MKNRQFSYIVTVAIIVSKLGDCFILFIYVCMIDYKTQDVVAFQKNEISLTCLMHWSAATNIYMCTINAGFHPKATRKRLITN